MSSEQQLQCYACGLPKVHPENDIVGSYGTELGKKMYNHTCVELADTMKDGTVDDRFLRTCPMGVKSCFGATGFYDHNDHDQANDLSELFDKNGIVAVRTYVWWEEKDGEKLKVQKSSSRRGVSSGENNFCSLDFCKHHQGNRNLEKEVLKTGFMCLCFDYF